MEMGDLNVPVNSINESHSGSPSPTTKKLLVFLVAAALFCDYLLLSCVIPILPDFLAKSFTDVQIGLLFASKPATQLLANTVMGPMVDTRGPKLILWGSTFILGLSTGVFAYGLTFEDRTAAYYVLLGARMVQGISSSAIMSAGMTSIAMTHHPSIHGSVMGAATAGVAAGVVLGPPIGGVMSDELSRPAVFYLVSGLLAFSLALQTYYFLSGRFEDDAQGKVTLFREPLMSHSEHSNSDAVVSASTAHQRPAAVSYGSSAGQDDNSGIQLPATSEAEQQPTPPSFVQLLVPVFRQPHIMVVALGNFFGNFCVGMMEVLVPLFLKEQYGESEEQQGLTFGVMSLAFLLATPVAGVMADKFPKFKVFMFGPVCAGLGLICLSWAHKLGMMYVSLVMTGVGVAFIDTPSLALMTNVAQWKGISQLGSVYSLQDMCTCLGFALGPVIATAVKQELGLPDAGIMTGSLLLLYSPFVLYLRDVPEPSDEEEISSL